jgi:hypothetical protein
MVTKRKFQLKKEEKKRKKVYVAIEVDGVVSIFISIIGIFLSERIDA